MSDDPTTAAVDAGSGALRFSPGPETFVVEERPAYEPCGVGPHTYLWIEKRDLSTPEAVRRLARALDVPERDIGYAGLKDRHAVTRQWVSVPDVEPERALTLSVDGLAVLSAARHGNKLRTGHLRGNRFEVLLEGEGAGEQAAVIEGRLRGYAKEGLPNAYGEQRFGVAGDNAEVALAVLRRERREPDPRRRRLLFSALQSAVFNEVLRRRTEAGTLARVLPGDVLQKRASGGLFVTSDLPTDQARVDAGELATTGPLPGTREVGPAAGSEADVLERESLAITGATLEDFARVGRDLPGARRPLLVPVEIGDAPVSVEGPDKLRVRFALPAGSYATVLVRALTTR